MNEISLAAMPLYTNLDRVARGLAAAGIGPKDPIPPEQLFALDQWHYHGTDAIRVAANRLGLVPASRVLDVGAGIGGPARYLAHTTGCHVTAIEIQPELNAIAVDLTERSGLGKRVEHVCADALTYPLQDASFDALVSWLAILHIPDRRRLCERLACAIRAGATDLTTDWAPYAAVRLKKWRQDREAYTRVYGEGAYAAQEKFYSVIDRLYESGSLGGLRLTAGRP